MLGSAYLDFAVRFREAVILVRMAQRSPDPSIASACSKSATVLLAAAMERYVNDAINHSCRRIAIQSWDGLAKGMQRFFVFQISRRLRDVAGTIESPSDATESRGNNLRSAIAAAAGAFENPSTWNHLPQIGVFMEGAAVPDRLNAVLRDFHPEGKTLFDGFEKRGLDRKMIARSIADLVSTRHATAHAIPDRDPPSPNDVAAWAVVTFRIVREIESFLEAAVLWPTRPEAGEI